MTSLKSKLIPVSMCLIGGLLLVAMVQINATLGKYIGPATSSVVAHAVGMIFIGLLAFRGWKNRWWKKLGGSPWYIFLGGVFGFLIVIISNYAIPLVGVTLYTTLYVVVSLILSVALDHFGLFGFPLIKINSIRILGMVICCLAVYLLMG
ncbi:DMT family transporter [bacterium]|nr:DMT family transporter [bacterium]